MLRQKTNKAFTIIEILVVIVIIIIFIIFAAPNVTNYTTDREVKKEVYSLVEYIKKKKAEVDAGKYPLVWFQAAKNPALWIMSHEEWAIQMKTPPPARTAQNRLSSYNNKSILNDRRGCPSSPRNYTAEGTQKWKKDSDVYKWDGNVRWKPNTHLCISKNAMIKPTGGEDILGIPGKSWLLICSTTNTTQSGSDRCHYNNRKKIDFRYVIKVDPDLKIEVYKYNIKKDKWILQ